jgi:hypothetical protein
MTLSSRKKNMSIILDALKQAEREHRMEKAEVLSTVCMEEPRKPSRMGKLGWVVAGLLVAALIIVMLFQPKPVSVQSTDSLVRAKMGSQLQHVKEKALEERVGHQQIPAGLQEGIENQTGVDQVLKARTLHSDTTGDYADTSLALPEAVKGKQVPEPVDTAREQPSEPMAEPPAVLRDPADNMTHTGPDTTALSNAGTERSIPLIDELPFEIQNRIPKMTIMAHAYHEDPSRCFAFINGQFYRVGNRIGPNGPVLKEITPDALIIDYGTGLARVPVK